MPQESVEKWEEWGDEAKKPGFAAVSGGGKGTLGWNEMGEIKMTLHLWGECLSAQHGLLHLCGDFYSFSQQNPVMLSCFLLADVMDKAGCFS